MCFKTGDLLYCKDRGTTSCCFHNESCAHTYDVVVHDRMTNNSINFLKNPRAYLADMVTTMEYDTCHAIKEYDASECAEDCRKLERSNFANDCREKGGFFKCCIR